MNAQVLNMRRSDTAILSVAEVDKLGRILAVCEQSVPHRIIPVCAQLDSVAACTVGMQVLVWYTQNGPVVVGTLLSEQQPPAYLPRHVEGTVLISSEKAISLHSGTSTIELHQSGEIRLEGEEIDVNSARDCNLTGWPIRLN